MGTLKHSEEATSHSTELMAVKILSLIDYNGLWFVLEEGPLG